jgi:hypothetical protein
MPAVTGKSPPAEPGTSLGGLEIVPRRDTAPDRYEALMRQQNCLFEPCTLWQH